MMTDQRMEVAIANLLRAGVSLAAALVLAGGASYVASSGRSVPNYGQFHPEVKGLGALATLDWPEKLIEIGLLVLIATPVARVALSLAAFVVERDRMYVWFTLAVLAVLVYSIGTAFF
jgi:uncharacterized membrane protein